METSSILTARGRFIPTAKENLLHPYCTDTEVDDDGMIVGRMASSYSSRLRNLLHIAQKNSNDCGTEEHNKLKVAWLERTRWANTYEVPEDVDPSSSLPLDADIWYMAWKTFQQRAQAGEIFKKPIVIKQKFQDSGMYEPQGYMSVLKDRFASQQLDVQNSETGECRKMDVKDFCAVRSDTTKVDHQMLAATSNAINSRKIANADAPLLTRMSRFRLLETLTERAANIGPGKRISSQVNDVSDCLGFDLLGFEGAFTRPRVDALMGTWVRCLSGAKAWIFAPGMDAKDWDDFARDGPSWCPAGKGRVIILEKDDVLLMPPGVRTLHTVFTLGPSLMEGELEDQKRSRCRYQKEARDFEKELASLKRRIEKNTFVAVLVDGDGAKFTSELLQARETGGGEAARRLNQAICHYLKGTEPELYADDASVVVHVWANLGDLAKVLVHDGSMGTTDQMSEFAEGFSRNRAEFNFVNVGRGKENADNKLRRMFNFYYNNIQCRKIFFAGCHDTGYVHDLEEKRGTGESERRIVLLETTPAEPKFRQLGFPIIHFDNVFRNKPLDNETKHSRKWSFDGTPSNDMRTMVASPLTSAALSSKSQTPWRSKAGGKDDEEAEKDLGRTSNTVKRSENGELQLVFDATLSQTPDIICQDQRKDLLNRGTAKIKKQLTVGSSECFQPSSASYPITR
ncbi:hypothetical protein MBLNU13_g08904t2 [Cladosporium sp. NU13]